LTYFGNYISLYGITATGSKLAAKSKVLCFGFGHSALPVTKNYKKLIRLFFIIYKYALPKDVLAYI